MSLPTENAVVADLISAFLHLFLANVLSLGLLSDMIQWFNHEILVVFIHVLEYIYKYYYGP
jgi:hypothetical protein